MVDCSELFVGMDVSKDRHAVAVLEQLTQDAHAHDTRRHLTLFANRHKLPHLGKWGAHSTIALKTPSAGSL